jgi:hypothetical protein
LSKADGSATPAAPARTQRQWYHAVHASHRIQLSSASSTAPGASRHAGHVPSSAASPTSAFFDVEPLSLPSADAGGSSAAGAGGSTGAAAGVALSFRVERRRFTAIGTVVEAGKQEVRSTAPL